MGRRWKKKKSRKEKKDQSQEDTRDLSRRGNLKTYTPCVSRNHKMEAYYALQGLHDSKWNEAAKKFQSCQTEQEKEEERVKFMTTMQSMLPASFRIGTDVDPVVREHLEQELDKFVGTEMEILIDPTGGRRRTAQDDDNGDGEQQTEADTSHLVSTRIAPAKRIPFISHAYQLSIDRRTIRRNPGLGNFHDWLKVQTLAGLVTRQETVSMLPPVVLSVEPHHAVLDMCAAPGSKTSQILETVSLPTHVGDIESRGCVVANDADPKRAYMLVCQLKRINSPAHLVTSCDAQRFPLLKSGEGEGVFDRVLADVPCSGDGTARKNPGIWKHWSSVGSFGLHPLQLSIALNGARLTKVGGFLCYSTCALNPIENEAVVAELLRATEGSLELVDRRPDLEGLVARPGWSTWRVLCEDQSRREFKNSQKKNNTKMQQRKRQWEEKRRREEGGELKDDTMDPEGNNDAGIDKPAAEPDKDGDDGDGDGDEAQSDNDKESEAPFSWDNDALKARAEAQGLIEYPSFDNVPEEMRRRVRKSCFPPTPEEVSTFRLDKCLRCLPHDMDSGGFFVALFRKVAPMSPKARAEAKGLALETRPDAVDDAGSSEPDSKRARMVTSTAPASEDEPADNKSKDGIDMKDDAINATADGGKVASAEEAFENEPQVDAIVDEKGDAINSEDVDMKDDAIDDNFKESAAVASKVEIAKGKPRFRGRGKTPVYLANDIFVPVDNGTWEPLVDFYGLSGTFPRDQYMVRASGGAKVLYFVGRPIKDLMDRGIQDRLTIINTGLKGFERNSRHCAVQYRIAQEGIQFLVPHMTKRKLIAGLDDFSKCLAEGGINLESFSSSFAEQVRALIVGSFVVVLEGFEQSVFKKMFLVMWRCRGDAINCLVAKVEKGGMMSKIRAIQEENTAET